MNREEAFETRLAEWLEEGPIAAPDQVIAAVVDHARANPRRRYLLPFLRRRAMNDTDAAPAAPRRILGASRSFAAAAGSIALVAVVAVSGLVMLAMRGQSSTGVTPASPSQATTKGYLFWASYADGLIGRANLDGSGVNPRLITGAGSPCGVAVIADHVYWGNDHDNTIGRANLDGSGAEPGFITGTGGGCTVVSDGTYLYWSSILGGEGGSIGRANLDGTNVEQAFISLVGRPSPLGLVLDGSALYYANNWGAIGQVPSLFRDALDRSGFLPVSGTPSGIACSGSNLYWGSANSDTIGRVTLAGTAVAGTPAQEAFIRISGNPGGLATDGTYLYWTSSGGIGRALLDGTGINETFVTGIRVPVAVAVAV